MLTLAEIEDFIQRMKIGETLRISGEYDPDPYGGGANWNYEMTYNVEAQNFVLKTNFYASQYNSTPEISYLDMNEEQAMSHLLRQGKYSVSCW